MAELQRVFGLATVDAAGGKALARIFIIGSGVVGTATGKGLLDAGHDVTFVDVLASRVRALRDEGMQACFELDLVGVPPSFIFLTLPTPNAGHEYDLSAFMAGTSSVGRALAVADPVHTVVIRSTVPPTTAQERVRPALERASGMQVDQGFSLASNPEFLRAASARDDFRWPWMTVVASRNRRTVERLVGLLEPFGGELRTFEDYATAEFVKCAHNIFNATKISFWNEMWLVAQELGVDIDAVAGTVARSAEASTNPTYGIRGGAPYGGVCLPKDTQGFLGFAKTISLDMPLLQAVVAVNDRLVEYVEQEFGSAPGDAQAGLPARERRIIELPDIVKTPTVAP